MVVIVLGTARSGTSLTAGICQALGVNMGGPLNPSTACPKGSFEDIDFLTITRKLHIGEEVMLGGIFKVLSCRKELWGFKSALTHHVWHQLEKWIKDPMFIVVHRGLHQTAESYLHHSRTVYGRDMNMDTAMRIIQGDNRVLKMRVVTLPKERVLQISFEGIKSDPVGTAGMIGMFLNIEMTDYVRRDVLRLVNPTWKSTDHDFYKL